MTVDPICAHCGPPYCAACRRLESAASRPEDVGAWRIDRRHIARIGDDIYWVTNPEGLLARTGEAKVSPRHMLDPVAPGQSSAHLVDDAWVKLGWSGGRVVMLDAKGMCTERGHHTFRAAVALGASLNGPLDEMTTQGGDEARP